VRLKRFGFLPWASARIDLGISSSCTRLADIRLVLAGSVAIQLTERILRFPDGFYHVCDRDAEGGVRSVAFCLVEWGIVPD